MFSRQSKHKNTSLTSIVNKSPSSTNSKSPKYPNNSSSGSLQNYPNSSACCTNSPKDIDTGFSANNNIVFLKMVSAKSSAKSSESSPVNSRQLATQSPSLQPTPAAESSSDDDDIDDEFQDADDFDILNSSTMDLDKAMDQSQIAINYFFNNKFEEARSIVTTWAKSSMYHATGDCVFAFLSATLTFDRELMGIANSKIKHAIHLCDSQRKKKTLTENLGSIVKKTNYTTYTDSEVHAELCYAELLLLKALLTFMEDEELMSLVKGSLKIKQCFNSYKECAAMLKDRKWTNDTSKNNFESGVRVGIGSFNLMISLLPGRIIRLLEFVGFSGDKNRGMQELHAGFKSSGIRQVLSTMTLLGYHLIVCYVITDQQGDLVLCEEILNNQLQTYPSGAWFLFFKARLEYMKGNLPSAIEWYKKSWQSQDIWPQFHHIVFWELLWIHCLCQQWRDALQYCDFLVRDSHWSKTIYSYQKAAVLMTIWDDLSKDEKTACLKLLKEAPTFKQKIAGKSLPMEKFVIKRCKKFEERNNLCLPALELMYLWNLFRVFNKNLSLGTALLKVLDNEESKFNGDHEDRALIYLLRGSILRNIGACYQAHLALDVVIGMKGVIKEETFLIPYAVVEMGLLYIQMGEKTNAIAALEDARNYTGYSLESRLHFRIHTTLANLKANSSNNV